MNTGKANPCSRIDLDRFDQVRAENRALQGELEFLKSRCEELERENQVYLHSSMEVQTQFDNLANIHVASGQLHAGLSSPEIIQVIGEIVSNLIGVEEYFLGLLDSRGILVIISGNSSNVILSQKILTEPDPILLGVLRGKQSYYRREGESSPYLVCVPLKVGKEVAGIISISKLMDQKKGKLSVLDRELLDLLAEHAVPALLHSQIGDHQETIQKVIEILAGRKSPGFRGTDRIGG